MINKLNSQLSQCHYELELARTKVKELENTEKHLLSEIRKNSEPENQVQILEKITQYLIKTSLYKNAKDCTIDIRFVCNEVNPKNDSDVALILEKLVDCGVLKYAYNIDCPDDYITLKTIDIEEFEEPYIIDCDYCGEEHEISKDNLKKTYKLNI